MNKREYQSKLCTYCKKMPVMRIRLMDEHLLTVLEEKYQGGVWFGEAVQCSECMAKEGRVYYIHEES